MATHTNPTARDYVDPNDMNLVEFWLRRDKTRWAAGIIAGLFAGLMTLAFAGILCAASGMEFLFPVKFMGMIIVGPTATEYGMNMGSLLAGFIFFEVLCAFWGFVYSHFVFTNALPALLGMGVVWGTFSWIFIWNLFLPAFRPVVAAQMPPGPVLFICLVFGLSLTSVAFFDRALRGGRA